MGGVLIEGNTFDGLYDTIARHEQQFIRIQAGSEGVIRNNTFKNFGLMNRDADDHNAECLYAKFNELTVENNEFRNCANYWKSGDRPEANVAAFKGGVSRSEYPETRLPVLWTMASRHPVGTT